VPYNEPALLRAMVMMIIESEIERITSNDLLDIYRSRYIVIGLFRACVSMYL